MLDIGDTKSAAALLVLRYFCRCSSYSIYHIQLTITGIVDALIISNIRYPWTGPRVIEQPDIVVYKGILSLFRFETGR